MKLYSQRGHVIITFSFFFSSLEVFSFRASFTKSSWDQEMQTDYSAECLAPREEEETMRSLGSCEDKS